MDRHEKTGMTTPVRTYSFTLLISITVIVGLILSSDEIRYKFTGEDGWGYIQEATNLLSGHGLTRAPSSSHLTLDNYSHSSAFPPGFPIVIALVARVFGIEPADAACWTVWISWALLPLAISFTLLPLIGPRPSIFCGILSALSPGSYQYGYVVLSDVPFLLLAVVSLGLLGNALKDDESTGSFWWAFAAGLTAGAAYTIRNAGVAIIAAVVAVLLAAILLRLRQVVWSIRIASCWVAGWLCFGLPLIIRNFFLFGAANPYGGSNTEMGKPFIFSIRMYLESLLLDLTASRFISMFAWDGVLLLGIGLPTAVGLSWLLWKWYQTADSSQRLVGLAIAFYLSAGSLMVILGRHLFPWVETELLRHVIQYTWAAFGLIAAAIGAGKVTNMGRPMFGLLLIGVAILLVARGFWIGNYLHQEATIAVILRNANDPQKATQRLDHIVIVTDQLKKLYLEDQELKTALQTLPPDAILATNLRSVAGLISGRSVRRLEFDAPSEVEPKVHRLGSYIAGRRQLYLLFFATNQIAWSQDYDSHWKAKLAHAIRPTAHIVKQTPWWLLMKYQVPAQ